MTKSLHPTGIDKEPVARVAKLLICGFALAGGAYFAFLYLVAGR